MGKTTDLIHSFLDYKGPKKIIVVNRGIKEYMVSTHGISSDHIIIGIPNHQDAFYNNLKHIRLFIDEYLWWFEENKTDDKIKYIHKACDITAYSSPAKLYGECDVRLLKILAKLNDLERRFIISNLDPSRYNDEQKEFLNRESYNLLFSPVCDVYGADKSSNIDIMTKEQYVTDRCGYWIR